MLFAFPVLLFLLALIPAKLAADKNHSFGAWYVFGVCMWLPAIIASVWIKDPRREEVSPDAIQRTDRAVVVISVVPVGLLVLLFGFVLFTGQQVRNGFCDTSRALSQGSSSYFDDGC